MNKEKLNIRQFKLINGEEIVAHVMQKDPGSYIVERPLRVLSNFIGGFTFQRWFPFSSQKLFKLVNTMIVYHVEIDEQIKHEYLKAASHLPNPQLSMKSDEDIMHEFEEFLEDYQSDLEPTPWPVEEKGKKTTFH
jgi:hypothetical protein